MSNNKNLSVLEIPYHATFFTSAHREIDDYREADLYKTIGTDYEVNRIIYDHNKYQSQNIEDLMARGVESAVETIDANIALGKVISDATKEAIEKNNKVLMTGGNCGHAVALAGGLQRALGKDKKIGLIWLDAHGDMNRPETSQWGMIGGMPLAVCGGCCLENWRKQVGLEKPIDENNIIISDARNLDLDEIQLLEEVDFIHIDTDGFNNPQVWKNEVQALADRVDVIYFHIDIDILDGKYVPNHATIEFDGIELNKLIENSQFVMETGKVIALAVVSVYFPNGKEGQEIATLSGMKVISSCLSNWK